MPDQFYERPELHADNQFYWEAFFDLSTERAIGMALGPIPRSAIRNYAAEFGLAGDRLEQFQRIIRSMDTEYLSLINTPQKGDQIAKTVSATDREGVAHLFDKLQNRARKAKPKVTIRKH